VKVGLVDYKQHHGLLMGSAGVDNYLWAQLLESA